MAKFGLGRNLADLQSEMGQIPDISILTGVEHRVVVKQIPLAQIGANPDQPRKTFTDTELSELAASIREKGVLQPILLRVVDGQSYQYEIVAGERRFRAAKMAGLTEIPALVKALSDDNAMEIALIENVQRENLNPIEEGAAYKNLMDKCGYEIADVCRLIGKSESYIRNIMRLGALPARVQELVANGELSASHARTIAVAEKPIAMAEKIIKSNMTVSDAAKMVRDSARNIKSRSFSAKTIDSATVRDMERRMSSSIGAPVKLTENRGGAGRITIHFASRVQLNELVEKLTK